MNKYKWTLIVILLVALAACQATPNPSNTSTTFSNQAADGTPTSEGINGTQSGALLSFNQIATPNATLNAASMNQQVLATPVDAVAAGGEDFAASAKPVDAGGGSAISAQGVQMPVYTIQQATNLQQCAEGFKISMGVVSGNVAAQIPHCYTINVMSTGAASLNMNLSPNESGYTTMIGAGKTAALFLVGAGGSVFVNGTQYTLGAVPTKFPFGLNDVASMTFSFNEPGGFARIDIKDSALEGKTPDIRLVDGSKDEYRLAEAGYAVPGSNNYCAWMLTFKIVQVTGDVHYVFTDCWQLVVIGNGEATLTFTPDPTGYDTASQGGVLGLWTVGNGHVTVNRAGVVSNPFVPEKGAEGIKFGKDSGPVTVTFKVEQGQVLVTDVGNERNNIKAQY